VAEKEIAFRKYVVRLSAEEREKLAAFVASGNRRVPDKSTLSKHVAAWQHKRNKHHVKADWQFKTDDARVKLKRLYPQVQ
jgi:hypothetical protein